jgi:hypothetical protein
VRGFRQASRVLADAIIGIIEEIGPPMGVRQTFYQCVVRELVSNSRSGYRRVQRLLELLRDTGEVDDDAIVDRSRSVHESPMWKDVSEFLRSEPDQYRKDVWVTQPSRVEVWLEKDALVGVVEEVTRELGVILVPARGFCSRTGISQAAKRINGSAKSTTIYYLGDHDPSGREMDRDIQKRLATKFDAHPTFKRLGIFDTDIAKFNLPPQKVKNTDSRARKFMQLHGTDTVELDALPPNELRRRIREAVFSHVDRPAWDRALTAETAERESLAAYVKAWPGANGTSPTLGG